MGNSGSAEKISGDPVQKKKAIDDKEIDQGLCGFRVLRVSKGGLADACGVEPYFDFLTHINQTPLSSDDVDILTILNHQHGSPVYIHIFNARTQQYRCVCVTPRPASNGNFSLGASVFFDAVASITNEGLRVLNVYPKSPAESAGVLPESDWILGSSQHFFKSIDELHAYISSEELINIKAGKDRRELIIELLMYNAESQRTRYVSIRPNNNWGGKGCLGIDVGTGALHHLRLGSPSAELSLDNNSYSNDEITNQQDENEIIINKCSKEFIDSKNASKKEDKLTCIHQNDVEPIMKCIKTIDDEKKCAIGDNEDNGYKTHNGSCVANADAVKFPAENKVSSDMYHHTLSTIFPRFESSPLPIYMIQQMIPGHVHESEHMLSCSDSSAESIKQTNSVSDDISNQNVTDFEVASAPVLPASQSTQDNINSHHSYIIQQQQLLESQQQFLYEQQQRIAQLAPGQQYIGYNVPSASAFVQEAPSVLNLSGRFQPKPNYC